VEESTLSSWKSVAPLRLRKLQLLGGSRYAADASALLPHSDSCYNMTNRQWTLHTSFRLGLPLTLAEHPSCPGCSRPMDSVGDHALTCKHMGVYARHNLLRNEVASLATDLGLSTELEVRLPSGPPLRPADVLIRGLEDQPVAVDVSVVHVLQSSHSLAELVPGKCAATVESTKDRQRRQLCLQHNWEYTPFVLETVGTWGGKARCLLQKLIKLAAWKKSIPYPDAAILCRGRLAAALTLGIARQLDRAFPEHLAEVAGPSSEMWEL
jgi:hypothetical protein